MIDLCRSVSAPPTPRWSGPRSTGSAPAPRTRDDLRLLTKHLLALLVAKAPGGAVEVRVPPYAAAQCLQGTRHTRGTPPAAVEMDAATWIALGDRRPGLVGGRAATAGVTASGERSDLGHLLPLVTG